MTAAEVVVRSAFDVTMSTVASILGGGSGGGSGGAS